MQENTQTTLAELQQSLQELEGVYHDFMDNAERFPGFAEAESAVRRDPISGTSDLGDSEIALAGSETECRMKIVSMLRRMTVFMNNMPEFGWRWLEAYKMTPAEFLCVACRHEQLLLETKEEFRELLRLFAEELKSLSLSRMLKDDRLAESLRDIAGKPEVQDFYRLLKNLAGDDATQVLCSIKVDDMVKAELLDSFRQDDSASFVSALLKSRADISNEYIVSRMWYNLNLICTKEILSVFGEKDEKKVVDTVKTGLRSVLDDDIIVRGEDEYMYYSGVMASISDDVAERLKDENLFVNLDICFSLEKIIIWRHKLTSHLSLDSLTAEKIDRLIMQTPYYRKMLELDSLDDIRELCGREMKAYIDFLDVFVSRSQPVEFEEAVEVADEKKLPAGFTLPDDLFERPVAADDDIIGHLWDEAKKPNGIAEIVDRLAANVCISGDIRVKQNVAYRFTGRRYPDDLEIMEKIKWEKEGIGNICYLVKTLLKNDGQGRQGKGKYGKIPMFFVLPLTQKTNREYTPKAFPSYADRVDKDLKNLVEERLFPKLKS